MTKRTTTVRFNFDQSQNFKPNAIIQKALKKLLLNNPIVAIKQYHKDIEFEMDYMGLLRIMNSDYVDKRFEPNTTKYSETLIGTEQLSSFN